MSSENGSKKHAKLGILVAVSLLFSLTGKAFAANYETTVQTAQFSNWAASHPDWVQSHHDQYEFYLRHPEAAQQYRSEWSDWRGNGHAFATWASQHPDWVTSHHDQYEFFLRHPDAADRYRTDWSEQFNDHHDHAAWSEHHMDHGDRVQFSEWVASHPDWVTSHRDRYEYFMHHPEAAQSSYSEWYGWHGQPGQPVASENIRFHEWVKDHPEWIESHRDRYEMFKAHPDMAE